MNGNTITTCAASRPPKVSSTLRRLKAYSKAMPMISAGTINGDSRKNSSALRVSRVPACGRPARRESTAPPLPQLRPAPVPSCARPVPGTDPTPKPPDTSATRNRQAETRKRAFAEAEKNHHQQRQDQEQVHQERAGVGEMAIQILRMHGLTLLRARQALLNEIHRQHHQHQQQRQRGGARQIE